MSKKKTRKNNKRSKRSKTWMMAQQLEPYSNFNWNTGKYSDKNIVDKAIKFNNANSKGYSTRSKFHYIYNLYQKYYWKLENEFRYKFDDYSYIFQSKQSSKDRSILIGYHLMMRIGFYYFVDSYNNSKKYSHKKGKMIKPKPFKVAWVLHDADISKNGGIVKPHIHIAFKFPKQVTSNQLAKWSGIAPQYFESNYKGRYAYDNELGYLIHAQQPVKHQYSPTRVHANFDYLAYAKSNKEKWEYRSAQVSQKLASHGTDWLKNQIEMNPAMTYQRILLNDKLFKIYCSMLSVDKIFEAKSDRIAAKTELLIKERKINLSVVYIWGKSGAGKTTEADRIIDDIKKKHQGWTVYKTAQSSGDTPHPFDDYKGEPIVYFDEARNTDLNASAWLSLLDPKHTNTLGARYHNKKISSRVIIITTTSSPYNFFGFMSGIHDDEPLTQFMRRLGIVMKVIELRDGSRQIQYQTIDDLGAGNHITINIGSSAANRKSTQFVPYPNNPKLISTSQATSKVDKYIERNVNPKIKHVPGKRPQLNSSAVSSLASSAGVSNSASLSSFTKSLKSNF